MGVITGRFLIASEICRGGGRGLGMEINTVTFLGVLFLEFYVISQIAVSAEKKVIIIY